ncbi:MAG: hypothetical protein AVDCRST_MAG87-3679 [uncultured Thermomicrobiales bacterium]|uniref:Uncharacterized protein n=1 Tax=uncultured Thermomicrobiales bacterium TaxID=1645740 RepID=A0A6J4VRY9_9BACT|nr:MAG: hypothetical protein AVDCRST_MAG87-3679 [uncultured Thermomicrobiales bacterium]
MPLTCVIVTARQGPGSRLDQGLDDLHQNPDHDDHTDNGTDDDSRTELHGMAPLSLSPLATRSLSWSTLLASRRCATRQVPLVPEPPGSHQ